MDFRLPLELEDCRKVFEESLHQETWEKRLGRSLPWREILHLSHPTSYFLPATHNLRKICRIKNKQGSFPGKDPCHGRHYALNYFVNSICSPSIGQRPLGFSRSYFSQHISTAVVSPFLLLAYASQHLPMLRLRGRLTPNHVPD